MMRAALPLALFAGLAACAEEPPADDTPNETNLAAEGHLDPNQAVGGDELSPVPEAVDDMVANGSGNVSGNEALPPPAIPGETR